MKDAEIAEIQQRCDGPLGRNEVEQAVPDRRDLLTALIDTRAALRAFRRSDDPPCYCGPGFGPHGHTTRCRETRRVLGEA